MHIGALVSSVRHFIEAARTAAVASLCDGWAKVGPIWHRALPYILAGYGGGSLIFLYRQSGCKLPAEDVDEELGKVEPVKERQWINFANTGARAFFSVTALLVGLEMIFSTSFISQRARAIHKFIYSMATLTWYGTDTILHLDKKKEEQAGACGTSSAYSILSGCLVAGAVIGVSGVLLEFTKLQALGYKLGLAGFGLVSLFPTYKGGVIVKNKVVSIGKSGYSYIRKPWKTKNSVPESGSQ